MRKLVVAVLLAALTVAVVPSAQAMEGSGRGGVMGFISGCCFGVRASGDYNEGKEIHWREWCRLIPYANIVFAVWDGVEGSQGVTRAQYAEQYGSMYF